MKSRQESHGITFSSYHVSYTKSTCYLKTSKSHANAPPTNQFMTYFIPTTVETFDKVGYA